MCGICGVYNLGSIAERHRRLVATMNNALHHRGPDGDGVYSDESVVLGHRRLSIIDLSGGDQPIFNEDESIAIVFNGEIYNYRELRKELLGKGHRFRTHSDTEVIVHLYEEKGVECVQDLNGMFAFALWDKNRRRLFIARDRFGEKPLYYHFNPGSNSHSSGSELIFASELKAVVKDGRINRDVDVSALDDYLAYGYVPAPKSIYQSVKKLPPAHYMVLENNQLDIHRYWSPAITSDVHPMDAGDAMERLRELMLDAINIRLRSDVPVGAFLSGGIDSSLIVALSAAQYGGKLTTFSVGFSERDFDELSYAKLVAERYQTDHHEIMLKDIDSTLFPRLVEHFDEPFADPSAVPTYYVTQEAARHLKVCLSGDAGDELFCGYGRYRPQLAEQKLKTIPESIRRPLFNGAANILPDQIPGKGLLRRAAASDCVHWQRTVGVFDSFERLNLWRREFDTVVDRGAWLLEPYFHGDISLTSQRMLADQNTYLSEDILVKVDRNSMWHSLEVRVPLLDHRLAELANEMPLRLKYAGEVQKYPLKHLLKGLVPDELLTRKKSGFGMPIKYWLKDRLYEYSKELLASQSTLSREFFDADKLSGLVEANRSGQRDLSRRLWTLMWFEQWMRNEKTTMLNEN